MVAENIVSDIAGHSATAQYDGYGSCPLTVERGKIVLAEFGYGGTLLPSFPRWLVDGTKPTRTAWLLKERILPPIYWRAMLRGKDGWPSRKKYRQHNKPGKRAHRTNLQLEPVSRLEFLPAPTKAKKMIRLKRYLPILDWGKSYDRETATNDLVAAVIVTIMLIPQSLAYALLAGLPPEVGLYASILPLVAYALFGTSRALAVGPVAVVSLMTASAVGELARQGTPEYLGAAIILAFLSGLMLIAMGLFRLGFLANLLSHPVISGFITASGLLIASSQLKHILGVKANGHTLYDILGSILQHLGEINWITFAIGVSATAFLFWVRKGLKKLLLGMGMKPFFADILTKAGPVAAVAVTTILSAVFQLGEKGVRVVGDIPSGLPVPHLPAFDSELWLALAGPALLISVIGFVESVSVAQTLAAKKRQRIEPDQELIGLGASNIASAISGGYPVTGGFARSVVNSMPGQRPRRLVPSPPSALRWPPCS